MSEAKHDPGPWHMGLDGHGGIRIVGDNGERMVGYISPMPDAEQRATAKLICAAPALLAACKDMLPLLEHAEACEASADDGNGHRLRSLRRRLHAAQAAVRQAEGQKP